MEGPKEGKTETGIGLFSLWVNGVSIRIVSDICKSESYLEKLVTLGKMSQTCKNGSQLEK